MWFPNRPFVYLSTDIKRDFLTRFYVSTKIYTMASTYTPDEIKDSGLLSTQQFTASTTYTFTITDKDIPGDCYLVLETPLHDSSLPMYFEGSIFDNLNNVTAIQSDIFGNHFGAVIEPQGTSTFEWTPSADRDWERTIM